MLGAGSFGTARVFAFIGLALLAAGCSKSETDNGALDTSRLPRVAGAKETFASAASTIFTSPVSVAQTADTLDKTLATAGWQKYVAPFTAYSNDPSMRIMSLKKGPQALSVFITVAPAQNNATSVQYGAVALKTDLPFTKDASNIEYAPDRPLLMLVTAEPVDKTLDFYRQELGARGWALWSEKTNGKQPAGGPAGEVHERGAYAHYITDKNPSAALVLTLQKAEAGKLKVELKEWPVGILEPMHKAYLNKQKQLQTPPVVSAPAPVPPPAVNNAVVETRVATPAKTADESIAEMLKKAEQITRDANAAALADRTPPAVAPAVKGSDAPLRVLAVNNAPVPVPENAEDVEFDGADGKLEFNSASSASMVAAFYRSTMKQQGWEEQSSVINNANMVVLNFSKARKTVTFTIMQMGNKANVSAEGSTLRAAAAKPAVADTAPPAAAPAPAAEQALEAEEMSGFPVPKRHTLSEGEQTPFRRALKASVTADLAAVLAFYRRELGTRGWKEETQGAVVKPDQAVIVFTSDNGPAVLKLGRKNGETSVDLALKNQAAAAKAGILPKPGQAKILFGNMIAAEAVVTINKQTVKVAAGVGAKKPDGPSLDLPPGKYRFSFKVAGKPAQDDEVVVGADETWGLLIGPGGALPLHAY